MPRWQALRKISAIISRSPERLPARRKVIEPVREKFACRVCAAIAETPAPLAPGPFLIAHILLCK
jgi:transposase